MKKKIDELGQFLEAAKKAGEAIAQLKSSSPSEQIIGLAAWEELEALITLDAYEKILSSLKSAVEPRAPEVNRLKADRTGTQRRRNDFLHAVRESGVAGFGPATISPRDTSDRVGPFELRYPSETDVEIHFLDKALRRFSYPSLNDIIDHIDALHRDLTVESDSIWPKLSKIMERPRGCSAPEIRELIESDGRKWKACEASVQYLLGRLMCGDVTGAGRMSIQPPDLAQQRSAIAFKRLDTMAFLKASRFCVVAQPYPAEIIEDSVDAGSSASSSATAEEGQ